jgi:heme exporter protein C
VVFVSAIIYLVKKESKYDIVGESSAEIGIVFTTIVLISGVLWAKPIWNIWWTWDPRLTTTFILWLIYVAYLLLRINLRDNVNMPTYAAIFGIIGFLDVPLVFMSIRWWRTIHPVVIRRTSIGLTKEMINVLIISIIANIFLFVVLLMLRVRIGKVQNELEVIKSIMEEELDRSKV